MTEQEAIDLEELKRAIRDRKVRCYDYLVSLDRLSAEQLKYSGYQGKSNAEAMQDTFKRAERDIEKLVDTHTRKYPD